MAVTAPDGTWSSWKAHEDRGLLAALQEGTGQLCVTSLQAKVPSTLFWPWIHFRVTQPGKLVFTSWLEERQRLAFCCKLWRWPHMLLGCGMKDAQVSGLRRAICTQKPWNQQWQFCLPINLCSWPASPFSSGHFQPNQISYIHAPKLSHLVI